MIPLHWLCFHKDISVIWVDLHSIDHITYIVILKEKPQCKVIHFANI